MPRETMSPRERWLAVLMRQTPDRIPMDYWATPEATQRLLTHLNCDFEEMLKRLHIDMPIQLGPEYVGPVKDGEDVFGIKCCTAHYSGGIYQEIAYSPLANFKSIEEIEANYTWPSPDWWDYSKIADAIKGLEHRPIRGGTSEPFLLYKALRGEQQAFIDLVDNPDIVHYCLDKLYDLAYQNALRIFESVPGSVMISYIAEDMGAQDRLMYSPKQIREFFLPRMKRMVELTKQHGSFAFTHSDGAIRDILPDLIEIGIEVINPVQWRCDGMDREGLKCDFGGKLVFHGAVDNQQTLPFGTIEEVRQEVLDNYKILSDRGGYILAPCHNIQSVSPPENIIAMYETGYECGWQN